MFFEKFFKTQIIVLKNYRFDFQKFFKKTNNCLAPGQRLLPGIVPMTVSLLSYKFLFTPIIDFVLKSFSKHKKLCRRIIDFLFKSFSLQEKKKTSFTEIAIQQTVKVHFFFLQIFSYFLYSLFITSNENIKNIQKIVNFEFFS